MPAESSVEKPRVLSPSFDLRSSQRAAMVSMAYVPLLHVLLCILVAVVALRNMGIGWALAAGAAALYLIPPLAVAMVRPRAPLADGRYGVGTSDFLRWWYTAQWQVVFNRLPLLEETLRLVPGLYSTWLRLSGAKIGRLVYWSPGLQVFDRPFLEIGNRVVMGANTMLSPHFLVRGQSGDTELVLAPIKIGQDAMIGGYALLPAGVCVGDCEQTPGGRPLAPFSRYENGRHVRTLCFHKESDNGK